MEYCTRIVCSVAIRIVVPWWLPLRTLRVPQLIPLQLLEESPKIRGERRCGTRMVFHRMLCRTDGTKRGIAWLIYEYGRASHRWLFAGRKIISLSLSNTPPNGKNDNDVLYKEQGMHVISIVIIPDFWSTIDGDIAYRSYTPRWKFHEYLWT